MTATIFTPYDMGNSETELHKHAGESVELVGLAYDADPAEGIVMQEIRFADGTTAEAFAEELTEMEATK